MDIADAPKTPPVTSKPVNEAEEFICLFSMQLGNNVLLYGAEMDGVDSEEKLEEPISWDHLKFVEVKTSKIMENHRQEHNFRKKILKWWCQCFLVNIESVLCGLRTDDGIVKQLKNYSLSRMVEMSEVNIHTAFRFNIYTFIFHYNYS